jgi:hypothetical protein
VVILINAQLFHETQRVTQEAMHHKGNIHYNYAHFVHCQSILGANTNFQVDMIKCNSIVIEFYNAHLHCLQLI